MILLGIQVDTASWLLDIEVWSSEGAQDRNSNPIQQAFLAMLKNSEGPKCDLIFSKPSKLIS